MGNMGNGRIRWSSKSRHGYELCYYRPNRPLSRPRDVAGIDLLSCPFRIYEEHDVDADNACSAEVWPEEYRMMFARNHVIKQELKAGNPVQFRVKGNSLYPRAHKGDCVIFEPVIYPSTLKVKDIVFCNLPGMVKCCAYMINEVHEPSAESAHDADHDFGRWLEFSIGTQSGHRVGSCYGQNIYGRIVEVLSPIPSICVAGMRLSPAYSMSQSIVR